MQAKRYGVRGMELLLTKAEIDVRKRFEHNPAKVIESDYFYKYKE